MNRESITREYVDFIIDSMDMDDLINIVADTLTENLNKMDEDSFLEEVENFYPDLLEEV